MKPVFLLILPALSVAGCFDNNSSVGKAASTPDSHFYSCLPCGRSCDTLLSTKSGLCKECSMELVNKASIVFGNIHPGSVWKLMNRLGWGNCSIAGGA